MGWIICLKPSWLPVMCNGSWINTLPLTGAAFGLHIAFVATSIAGPSPCNGSVEIGGLGSGNPAPQKIGERTSAASILQRMYNSLVEKLKCCHLNATMALSLLEAIDDSNLPPEKKEFLLKALDGTAMASSNFKRSKCQQGVSHLPNYFSESDWAKFRKHTSLMGAMAVLIRRMKQMGLVSLTETCKKQALALLLHWSTEHGKPLPGPWQIYFVVKDFQALFTCTNVPCSVGSLETHGIRWTWEKTGLARYMANMRSLLAVKCIWQCTSTRSR
jgi:hypothetical protein